MRFIRRGALPGAALVLALVAPAALGQGSTVDEIAKYLGGDAPRRREAWRGREGGVGGGGRR